MKNKKLDFSFDIKALETEQEGLFEGYASIFGNKDSHSDIVMPGAFSESLQVRTPVITPADK